MATLLRPFKGKSLRIVTSKQAASQAGAIGSVSLEAREPLDVERARLLRAAAEAGVTYVQRIRPDGAWQAPVVDALAPWHPGLSPVLPMTPERASVDHEAEQLLRDTIAAAAEGRYRKAAAGADALRAFDDRVSPGGRPRLRHGLRLLASAGIALAATKPLPPLVGPPPSDLGAYEAWWWLRLDSTMSVSRRATLWSRVAPQLPEARRVALESRILSKDECKRAKRPALAAEDELVGLSLEGGTGVSPDLSVAIAGRGSQWLKRYSRIARRVDEADAYWSLLPALLRHRGHAVGLSASQSATYKKVNERALDHVVELERLAARYPKRFAHDVLVRLGYLPGVMRDRVLSKAVTLAMTRTTERQLGSAQDPEALVEAVMGMVAMVLSSPSLQRLDKIDALRAAVAKKLDGPLGRKLDGRVVAIRALDAIVSALRSDRRRLQKNLPGLRGSLVAGRATSFARLVPLADAVARYGELAAAGNLDATVSNPKMFSKSRVQAREALRRGIEELAPGGPKSLSDKALARQLTKMLDGLLASAAAGVQAKPSKSCVGRRVFGKEHALRDSFDRLAKVHKALLASASFERGESLWATRARALVVFASDAFRFVDRVRGKASLSIERDRAAAIIEAAVRSWVRGASAERVASTYALVTGWMGTASAPSELVEKHLPRMLAALEAFASAPVFGIGNHGAEATRSKRPSARLPDQLLTLSARAKKAEKSTQAQLLELLALTAASREEVRLAGEHTTANAHGSIATVLHQSRFDEAAAAALPESVRKSAVRACVSQRVGPALAIRGALRDARQGALVKARLALAHVVDQAPTKGLDVPVQLHRYQHRAKGRTLDLSTKVSLAWPLLSGAHTFHLSVGLQSREARLDEFRVKWIDPSDAESIEQAARLYAHAAAVASLLHGLKAEGVPERPREAARYARLAVEAWVHGVRLGARTARPRQGVSDAVTTLLLLAQQSAERGDAWLSGDLWTLARQALGAEATDATVERVLTSPPWWIASTPGLDALAQRALPSAKIAASTLPCTSRLMKPKRYQRVGCQGYPLALGLRMAEGLPLLPVLVRHAERHDSTGGTCRAWRQLNVFLHRMQEGSYDPDAFTAALSALVSVSRFDDAAALLSRHRRRGHCSPLIIDQASKLGRASQLGAHLRADALSVALNCAGADVGLEDLRELDRLTAGFADLGRNVQVMLFATRMALATNESSALREISTQSGFYERYAERGPVLATTALVVSEASRDMSKSRATEQDDGYRLMCLTLPHGERGALCQTLGLLRDEGPGDKRRRLVRQALQQVVDHWLSTRR